MFLCAVIVVLIVNVIRWDAPKLKFLSEAKKNETLGRGPNTEHCFVMFFLNIFCLFFTIAYIK